MICKKIKNEIKSIYLKNAQIVTKRVTYFLICGTVIRNRTD